jgi:hypothetical protein
MRFGARGKASRRRAGARAARDFQDPGLQLPWVCGWTNTGPALWDGWTITRSRRPSCVTWWVRLRRAGRGRGWGGRGSRSPPARRWRREVSPGNVEAERESVCRAGRTSALGKLRWSVTRARAWSEKVVTAGSCAKSGAKGGQQGHSGWAGVDPAGSGAPARLVVGESGAGPLGMRRGGGRRSAKPLRGRWDPAEKWHRLTFHQVVKFLVLCPHFQGRRWVC